MCPTSDTLMLSDGMKREALARCSLLSRYGKLLSQAVKSCQKKTCVPSEASLELLVSHRCTFILAVTICKPTFFLGHALNVRNLYDMPSKNFVRTMGDPLTLLGHW